VEAIAARCPCPFGQLPTFHAKERFAQIIQGVKKASRSADEGGVLPGAAQSASQIIVDLSSERSL
jgi:hypothetical protein